MAVAQERQTGYYVGSCDIFLPPFLIYDHFLELYVMLNVRLSHSKCFLIEIIHNLTLAFIIS